MSVPFLLEIGTEEIPDWMIPTALENLAMLFEKLELPHETGASMQPRAVSSCASRTCPIAWPIPRNASSAPPKSAPLQAVAGFARKQGIGPEDLVVESTPKGEYYSFTGRWKAGAPSTFLPKLCPASSSASTFPRRCTGPPGRSALHPPHTLARGFARREIVPFEIAGVHSGNMTSGHRPRRARDRGHRLRLRTASARSLRNPLRRGAPHDRSEIRRHPRHARRSAAGDAGLPNRIPYRRSPAASTRNFSNSPKKYWSR